MKRYLRGYMLLAQLSALLAIPYLLLQAWNPALYPKAVLVYVGLGAMPRWFVAALSSLSVWTASEYFLLLGVAVYVAVVGILVWRIEKMPRKTVALSIVLGLNAVDILSRCLPFWDANHALAPVYQYVGLALRVLCLVALVLALIAEKKCRKATVKSD